MFKKEWPDLLAELAAEGNVLWWNLKNVHVVWGESSYCTTLSARSRKQLAMEGKVHTAKWKQSEEETRPHNKRETKYVFRYI